MCVSWGVHQVFDRQNQLIHCMATLRWTYTFDSAYLAVGLAALQPNVCTQSALIGAAPTYQRAWSSAI